MANQFQSILDYMCSGFLPHRFSSAGECSWLWNTFKRGFCSNESAWWGHRVACYHPLSTTHIPLSPGHRCCSPASDINDCLAVVSALLEDMNGAVQFSSVDSSLQLPQAAAMPTADKTICGKTACFARQPGP